jgi:hypothetical protein
MLRRRLVTAADVAATRASAQMEPPPIALEALDTAIAARRNRRVDPRGVGHGANDTPIIG